MKIAFLKVTSSPTLFEVSQSGVSLAGELKRKSHSLVALNGKIFGEIEHNCDRCGEDISLKIDEDLSLILSDGEYKASENELNDVIEFFDGFIDLDEVLLSEIEAYKSDYFIVIIVNQI